jgi:hypothetical protein
MEILADQISPQAEYLALQTEKTLLLRISEGGPTDEALAPAIEWTFRLPMLT